MNVELPVDNYLTDEQVFYALKALEGMSSLQIAIAAGIKDEARSKELFLKAANLLKEYMDVIGVKSALPDEEVEKVLLEAWETVRDTKAPAPTLFPATQKIH